MTKENINLEDTEKFLGPDLNDPSLTKIINDEPKVSFNGLSKEEIMRYADDPFWVKIRWFLFFLFWFVWVGMLASAVIIVVHSPKCPYKPKLKWWQNNVIYQLDVENFVDSDSNGQGDLDGLFQKLDYFDLFKIKSLCLKDNILKNNLKELNENFGNFDQLKALKKELEKKDMYLIIDLPFDKMTENSETIVEFWLRLVDGVRVTGSEVTADLLKKWIKIADDIHSETFKYKLIAAVGKEDEDHKDLEYLNLRHNFANLKTEDLKDINKFLMRLENMKDVNGYEINKYNNSRIKNTIDSKLINIYHSLVLLLKGSPVVLYGDELEMVGNEKRMKWNSSLNCGFSKKTNISVNNCKMSVKESSAKGSGETLLKTYVKLLKLREEPSFKWGELKINLNETLDVISFVREAQGFNGYLVAANVHDNESKLVDFTVPHDIPVKAHVTHFFSSNPQSYDEFKLDTELDSTHIMLQPHELLILKFSRANN
ncbi:unnamed protein product [Brachionus calyciflorus]|uniref:Uncharacterized protein n=1 Tax=Brachionus calyciflorus TaxID=104777 RepID=A0A813N209_9BILA|nr:unnamed protein product [Brachionus calyciflorus]